MPKKFRDSRLIPMIIFVGFITILKLYVVSSSEIIAMPYDSAGYVQRSLSMDSISHLDYQLTGYPIWLYISRLTGLPQRISIELFYILSCIFFVFSLRFVLPYLVRCILIIILVFYPCTYSLFELALTDSFYLPLTLFSTGLMISLLFVNSSFKIKIVEGICLGVVFGTMMITRVESLVIYCNLAVLTAFYIQNAFKIKVCQRIKISLLPLVAALLTSQFIVVSDKIVHYVTDGVYASSLALMPSHLEMLSLLSSIDVDNTVRYVPISRDAMLLASKFSPNLEKLLLYVHSDNNHHLIDSTNLGLPKGEIGGGWILYTFLDARGSIDIKSLTNREFSEYFRQINSDLNNAFTDGYLKKRLILHPMLGDFYKHPGFFMPSFLGLVNNVLVCTDAPRIDYDGISSVFDRGCLRRNFLNRTSDFYKNYHASVDYSNVVLQKLKPLFGSNLIFIVIPFVCFLCQTIYELFTNRFGLSNFIKIQLLLILFITTRLVYYSLIQAYSFPFQGDYRYLISTQILIIIFSCLCYYSIFNGLRHYLCNSNLLKKLFKD